MRSKMYVTQVCSLSLFAFQFMFEYFTYLYSVSWVRVVKCIYFALAFDAIRDIDKNFVLFCFFVFFFFFVY